MSGQDDENGKGGSSRRDLLKMAGAAAAGVAVAGAVRPDGARGSVSTIADEPGWLKAQEGLVDDYMDQFLAVPAGKYPLSKMLDSLERRNLVDRLLRFNKASKIGYLYLMSFGKFVGYYVIKGKVSSVNSQLTPTDKAYDSDGGSGHDEVVVASPGDDGSWGPNEGGDRGIFFFTSNDVMVETTLDWLYSDGLLPIDVVNLGHNVKPKK